MKTGFRFVAAMITLALSGAAATQSGCNGGAQTASLCADVCACQRCTDNDLEACEEAGNKSSDAAEAAGCSSQFEEAVNCAGAHVSCKGDQAVAEGCEVEMAALTTCSSTLSVFDKNPCEKAADAIVTKYTGCGGDLTQEPGTSTECTAAAGTLLACQAACYVAADCTVIIGDSNNPATSEQLQAFSDCITQCQ